MAGFDSLMLTSNETISLMEGAAAGGIRKRQIARESDERRREPRDRGTHPADARRGKSRRLCLKLAGINSRYDSLIKSLSYLSPVRPPQAVAGFGGCNGDNWRCA